MRDEITSDATSEVAGDVTWMSYADLGRARGISAASAKRLAIRRHWRRRQGNDGTARVAVPVTEAVPHETKSGDDPGDVTGNSGLLAGALAALEDAIVALREQLDAANTRAERAEADRADERLRADSLRTQIDALNAEMVAARAEAVRERHRADERRATIEDLRAEAEARARELTVARRDALTAHQVAERENDARRARGLVARLRAAWRGVYGRRLVPRSANLCAGTVRRSDRYETVSVHGWRVRPLRRGRGAVHRGRNCEVRGGRIVHHPGVDPPPSRPWNSAGFSRAARESRVPLSFPASGLAESDRHGCGLFCEVTTKSVLPVPHWLHRNRRWISGPSPRPASTSACRSAAR
jgi:hypothetical protein